MFVVIGSPIALSDLGAGVAGGLAAGVAIAAARAGAGVQLVGKLGDDPAGDQVLLSLAEAGVGHVALVRDVANPTPMAAPPPAASDALLAEPERGDPLPLGLPLEPADLELALRYLSDYSLVVVAEPQSGAVTSVAAEAAAYAGASLIVVAPPGTALPLPSTAITLEAPATDPDGAFAMFVGRLGAAIDAGASPTEAFAAVSEAAGVTPAV